MLDRVEGVVIAAQADMWDPEKGAAHQTGYEPFVASIASHTTSFGKPVLMFNGDSHVYQSGQPARPGRPRSEPLQLRHPRQATMYRTSTVSWSTAAPSRSSG